MAEAVVEYCFTTLQMNRIGAEIYSINPRSIQLFESAGFIREGVLRQSVLKQGKYAVELQFGLLSEEWNRRGEVIGRK